MTAPSERDSLHDLERHRLQLEQNVEKLNTALQRWRIWDAEYEGLKEEVARLADEADKGDITRLRADFPADVLTEKDLDEILGKGTKTPKQITNVLERRIDYVTRNIKTLENQLVASEHKLSRVSILSDPDMKNDEGEPILDIFEQLDEDDNVLSSRVQTAGSAQADAISAALKKAGVEPATSDKPSSPAQKTVSVPEPGNVEEIPSGGDAPPAPAAEDPSLTLVAETTKPKPAQPKSILKKKSVSFAETTKPADNGTKSATALHRDEILKANKEKELQFYQTPPVIPTDESTEDALLRQAMLQYSREDASELGAVVAELNIEDEFDVDDNDEEDWIIEDYGDVDGEFDVDFVGDISDDDHQSGFSSNGVLTDDYQKRMMEIQDRLKDVMASPSIPNEDIPSPNMTKVEKSVKVKKGVQFAMDLDIAPNALQAGATPAPKALENPQEFIRPIANVVVERSPTAPVAKPRVPTVPAEKPKRISRFKQAQAAKASGAQSLRPAAAAIPPVPSSASSSRSPLTDTVVERTVSSAPQEPDELDQATLYRAVAVEYSRMRTNFVQREGGFLREQGQEIEPLDEEYGGPKKVSLFKAARLGKQ
ncbi:hypothetical protein MKZ38_004194 [Zalerion maritima]|uniref:DUF3835 domain-containing protein n=1 Tax=Zalerion maritima TaxID=339359 RepID=A0AAD5RLW9_9PEZI|nr:hypothetical protein MKZ38_004194 [Zalerion maritima]